MNEIALRLNELNEDRFKSLESPTIDDLTLIEEQLLIGLPVELREFLIEVSHVVFRDIEPVTVMDPNLHTYLPEVASVAWDLGVSRELIPICLYGDDYYCVSQDGEVVLWHQGEQSEQTWDSVWNWVSDVWLQADL